MHPELKVLRVCEQANMTPQNYYARRTAWRRQTVDVALLLELVRAERKYQPRLGGRKLYYLVQVELKAAGVKLGRDRLFEELKKAGMLVERWARNGLKRRVSIRISRCLRT